jgi:hypothetical protein
MSDQITTTETPAATDPLALWGDTAPRGGRAVLNRMLKGDGKVPLFIGQTLIKSLRDQGYNSTTSALCEFVDNSLQWGATEVRVYIAQAKRDKSIRIVVVDNGRGMSQTGQRVAMSFGGSMAYEARAGISRFGMGMKTAGLSISPTIDNYSWQEPRAYYNVTLDVNELGSKRDNTLEVPESQLNDDLPSDLVDILIKPTTWPKNPEESQTLLATSKEELHERLGGSGTIVYLSDCDRLSYKKEQTLAEHAIKEMGRVYRRFIAQGRKLYVNNRLVEAFDPTYQMAGARHTRVEGLTETRSRLIFSKVIEVPVSDGEAAGKTRVIVKLFALPYDAWVGLGRKTLKNDLQVFGDYTVSFVRNDREVDIGATVRALGINKHATNNWLRLEVDFNGEADEGFGIASNKQGVRLRDFAAEVIRNAIEDPLIALRKDLKELKARHATLKSVSTVSEAERRATGAEGVQAESLPVEALTDEQKVDLVKNLRALAAGLKRNDESDEQAFDRVQKSKFLTRTVHNDFYPFFDSEYKYERIILTVNTAHTFYQKVWQPLEALARTSAAGVPGEDEDAEANPDTANTVTEALVGLQMLFFSLARTQARIVGHDRDGETKHVFKLFRKEWSEGLETMMRSDLTSEM